MATSSLSLSTTTSSSLGTTHMNNTVGGLDVDALVSATIQADSLPMVSLQNKNARLQAQLNDYNTIRTALGTLQYAATDLTYASTFSAMKATSSDEKVVTASSQNGGTSGSYVINVGATATITSNTSAAVATSNGTKATLTGSALVLSTLNTALNETGTFTINGKGIAVTATDTVNTIVNKITASGAGVTASVGTDGKITITQNTVGATPTITINDSSNLLSPLGLTGATVNPGLDSDESRTLDAVFGTGAIQSGYFSINGTFFSVDSTKDSIDSIINKINSSTTVGATAFFNSTTHTISLTSKTAGAKDITLGTNSTDSSDFLSKVGLVQANQIKGTDATVTVNGVSVTPVNNQVVFNGNTFTLAGTGTATVSVQSDVSSMVAKVQTFITAYNAAMDAVNNKLNEKSDSTSSDASVGDLFGDPTLASINNMLRNMTSTIVTSQPSSMQQLSQAGITTGAPGVFDSAAVQSGHLVLDTAKLTAALQSNPQAVTSLFGNTMASVTGETVTGAGTAYTLQHGSVSGTPTIKVNGVAYTQVSGTPKAHTAGAPDATHTTGYEYSLDYTTGKIIFGSDPITDFGPAPIVTADYSYDISSGSNAGIFVQMQTMLNNNTQSGGSFDALTGSDGSLTNTINYNNARISDLKTRLAAEQATLYTKYQNMQTILSTLQSQGSYMTSLLASMNSSK